jgi:hypothetical protein
VKKRDRIHAPRSLPSGGRSASAHSPGLPGFFFGGLAMQWRHGLALLLACLFAVAFLMVAAIASGAEPFPMLELAR